ncbi:MAG: DUF7352 domain-containing protein [Neobacillus sp.]
MYTVWKYTLNATQKQQIDMPLGSKILNAELQHEEIVLYALINKADVGMTEDREIIVLGTGHEIDEDLTKYQFVNTVVMNNGYLMFHVFASKSMLGS